MFMTRWVTADQKKSIRHWAMEFVIVVAGVLLALWLQQWGERQRALADMRAAEEAIHDEVRTALLQVVWRKAISQCHLDRQQLLKSMLLKTDGTWPGIQENALAVRTRVPASVVPSIYSRPYDTFTTAAWTSALATGALAPMDRERFGNLVAIYDQIEIWKRARDEETEAVTKMAALAFPMTLTPELKTRMLEGLYQIDRIRFMFALVGPRDLANSMRELGWDDTKEMDRAIRAADKETKALGFVWRSCVAKVENPFRSAPAN